MIDKIQQIFRVQAYPRNQDFRVPNVAFNASFKSLGPDQQFRFGIVATLLRQRLSNIRHGPGMGSPLPETDRPASKESTGNDSSEAIVASTALPSCFRVTMWVRGTSVIL